MKGTNINISKISIDNKGVRFINKYKHIISAN